jgi:putative transposase
MQRPSGEVHYDPYDAAHVCVRHPDNQGWVTLTWKYLHRAPIPFGELAWNHVRGAMPAHSTEADIAEAVQQLLVKASHGPTGARPGKLSARDRRVAAPEPPRRP